MLRVEVTMSPDGVQQLKTSPWTWLLVSAIWLSPTLFIAGGTATIGVALDGPLGAEFGTRAWLMLAAVGVVIASGLTVVFQHRLLESPPRRLAVLTGASIVLWFPLTTFALGVAAPLDWRVRCAAGDDAPACHASAGMLYRSERTDAAVAADRKACQLGIDGVDEWVSVYSCWRLAADDRAGGCEMLDAYCAHGEDYFGRCDERPSACEPPRGHEELNR